MDLYIIRHAWAEPRDAERWPNDDLRPLTPEGIERFQSVVKKLRKREFAPEVVATSPLVRCRQTAEIVARLAPEPVELVELDALAPGSDTEELMEWTNRQAQRYGRIAWVGHAPDVGDMAAEIVGEETGQFRFAKGAVAAIRFVGPADLGEGELRWLVTAKLLGC